MNNKSKLAFHQSGITNPIRCTSEEYQSLPEEQKAFTPVPNAYFKYDEPTKTEDMIIQLMATNTKNISTIKNVAIFMTVLTVINIVVAFISIF